MSRPKQVHEVQEGALAHYDRAGFYCEMVGDGSAPLAHTAFLRKALAGMDRAALQARARDAERELYNLGITFTVYSEKDSIDRILPFDVIPRVLLSEDWAVIEAGVRQRVTALNLLLHDVYHEQKILKDDMVPADLILGNEQFRPEVMGLTPRHGTYVHICGIDIVRDETGRFFVLEDNGCTPSGVSYVIENRQMMRRAFPDLMAGVSIRRVSDYGIRLQQALTEIAPPEILDPQVVLLSPGVHNSAYFEHVFLAREMGVPLVEGQDLVVENDIVRMKTTAGLKRVDVIYRRMNDDFLDPEALRPDSLIGVPGLLRAFRKGTLALANAIGNGVADDKATYAYMPRIIKYYLDEEPILPNVETNICREQHALSYTLDHLEELVVKPVGESGGYGLTVGPTATRAELEACRARLISDPANFISQPMIKLSVCPTLTEEGVAARHVDLRPFAVTGQSTFVLPGGLTRVALRPGSLVVNSSQGGGSKDTWVLD